MVPWPIALLALFYGGIAAYAGATIWQSVMHGTHQPLWGPMIWLTVCGSLACGLPLLKPWARRLAVIASMVMMMSTVALAALLIAHRQPGFALAATLSVVVYGIIIRYLQRPNIKAYFTKGDIRYQNPF